MRGNSVQLRYFKDATTAAALTAEALGEIELDHIMSVDELADKPGRFDVLVPGRVYALKCENASELRKWVSILSTLSRSKQAKPDSLLQKSNLPATPQETMKLVAQASSSSLLKSSNSNNSNGDASSAATAGSNDEKSPSSTAASTAAPSLATLKGHTHSSSLSTGLVDASPSKGGSAGAGAVAQQSSAQAQAAIDFITAGAAFIRYEYNRETQQTSREIVSVFYRRNDGTPLGSIYWCEPGDDTPDPSAALALHTLTGMYALHYSCAEGCVCCCL